MTPPPAPATPTPQPPLTPFAKKLDLVKRQLFSRSPSVPNLDEALLDPIGLAEDAPKGSAGIAEMLVGILTSEGSFSEDEVPKAEKLFADRLDAIRVRSYSTMLSTPAEHLLSTEVASESEEDRKLVSLSLPSQLDIVLGAAKYLSTMDLFLTHDADLGQLTKIALLMQSTQHGGAVALAQEKGTQKVKQIEAYKTKVAVKDFPKDRDGWKDWIKATELAFTVSLQKEFLDSEQKCKENLEVSRQHCATLLLAFTGTNQASTVESFSTDLASEFWKSVQSHFRDAIDIDEEQRLTWQKLFDLSCSSVHQYDIFSSKFKSYINILKRNNSVALSDRNLMLASLQYSLNVTEFETTIKNSITDSKITYEELVEQIEQDYRQTTSRSEQTNDVADLSVRNTSFTPKQVYTTKEKPFSVPPIPVWMKEYMAPQVFACLQKWQKTANKCTFDAKDADRVDLLKNKPNLWNVGPGKLKKEDTYKSFSNPNLHNPNKEGSKKQLREQGKPRYDDRGRRDYPRRDKRHQGESAYGSRSSRSASYDRRERDRGRRRSPSSSYSHSRSRSRSHDRDRRRERSQTPGIIPSRRTQFDDDRKKSRGRKRSRNGRS